PRHSPSYFSRRRPHPILTLFTYTTLFRSYQSAIKAGYSESYAKSSSYKLLDIVGISQEIERVREEELDKVQKRFAIGATKAIKWMLESLEDDEVPPTVKSNVAKNLLDYEIGRAHV